MSIFIQEIYGFLQTISVYNPYMKQYYKNKLEALTIDEIKDAHNPYVINLQGEFFNTADIANLTVDGDLLYPELASYNHAEDPAGLNNTPMVMRVQDLLTIDDYTDLGGSVEAGETHRLNGTIPLTKSTLNDSRLRKTSYFYYYNRDGFTDLLERYPDQADLIKNIFYPVTILEHIHMDVLDADEELILKQTNLPAWETYISNIDKFDEYTKAYNNSKICFDMENNLIQVNDFELIGYSAKGTELQPQFLEYSELGSIVQALQSFLIVFNERWNVPEYMEFEKYGHIIYWTILWTLLPNVVLQQRIDNMHTASVHTDLIWAYLKSKGIGDYRDVLNDKQQMFMYKNIRYLLNHKGTIETLEILANNLLKDYNITLVSKYVAIETSGSESRCVPTSQVLSKDITKDYINIGNIEAMQQTLATTYAQEVNDGIEPDIGPDLLDEQDYKLSRIENSTLPTKLVQFVRTNVSYQIGLEYIKYALESFTYMLSNQNTSCTVDYDNLINVRSDRVSGGLPLTIKEAFALFQYCLYSAEAPTVLLTPDNIDNFIDKDVIFDKSRVLITNQNANNFIGAYVTYPGPSKIPTKFSVRRPFKLNLAEITKEFLLEIHGASNDVSTINIDYIFQPNLQGYLLGLPDGATPDADEVIRLTNIDAKNNPSPDLTTRTLVQQGHNFSSKEELVSWMDTTYGDKLSDFIKVRTNSDKVYNRSFDYLYYQLLEIGIVDIEYDTFGSITTYEEWFDTNDSLRNLTDSLNAADNPKIAFGDLMEEILVQMLPIKESDYVQFGDLTAEEQKLMRQLFVQMCTYDITFFDTSSLVKDHEILGSIIYDDTAQFELAIPSDASIKFIAPKIGPILGTEPADPIVPIDDDPTFIVVPREDPPPPPFIIYHHYKSNLDGQVEYDLASVTKLFNKIEMGNIIKSITGSNEIYWKLVSSHLNGPTSEDATYIIPALEDGKLCTDSYSVKEAIELEYSIEGNMCTDGYSIAPSVTESSIDIIVGAILRSSKDQLDLYTKLVSAALLPANYQETITYEIPGSTVQSVLKIIVGNLIKGTADSTELYTKLVEASLINTNVKEYDLFNTTSVVEGNLCSDGYVNRPTLDINMEIDGSLCGDEYNIPSGSLEKSLQIIYGVQCDAGEDYMDVDCVSGVTCTLEDVLCVNDTISSPICLNVEISCPICYEYNAGPGDCYEGNDLCEEPIPSGGCGNNGEKIGLDCTCDEIAGCSENAPTVTCTDAGLTVDCGDTKVTTCDDEEAMDFDCDPAEEQGCSGAEEEQGCQSENETTCDPGEDQGCADLACDDNEDQAQCDPEDQTCTGGCHGSENQGSGGE